MQPILMTVYAFYVMRLSVSFWPFVETSNFFHDMIIFNDSRMISLLLLLLINSLLLLISVTQMTRMNMFL